MNKKKVVLVIAILWSVVFLLVLLDYVGIKNFIKNYEEEMYTYQYFSLPVLHDSYEKPYNLGTANYQSEAYMEAASCFERALNCVPPEEKDCDVRINLALSYVKQIDPKEINEDTFDVYMQLLLRAREVLLENGCAAEDGAGHDDDAQTLKEEIDAFIMAMETAAGSDSKEDEEQQGDEQEEPSKETPAEEPSQHEEALQKMQELGNQSNQTRNESLESYWYLGQYEYYKGATW